MASKLIVLDDGHGLDTPGKAAPDGVRENQFNSAKVGFLATALKRCGFRVELAAPEDKDISLKTRAQRANSLRADAFISDHYNAFRGNWDETQGGVETHYYPGSVEGQKLAACVQKHIALGTPQINRGIKASNFAVLRETNMVAILIENGFMDVRKEAELMLDLEFQKEQAEQTAQGVCEYFGIEYVPEPTSRNALAEAIGAWVRAGLLNSPEYWLRNAVPGSEVKGEYVSALIIAGAKKLNEHLP